MEKFKLILILLCMSILGDGKEINKLKSKLFPKECPVVGNTKSKIFHVRGGEFYERMLILNKDYIDNRECFKNKKDAEKAGYRESKI